ncbi:hypothetical protein B0T10DRAFT_551073 [Thelonectria olida]|uniref:NmrA-like domain-containing protein n=1 Tax=Thelonectria olida TaxID=1576542 RepID=A0A9P8VYR3_9HYPO|nr:hypothetical protein B0T10DRAFT_551073 [Thelonectria olida]
MFSSKIIAVVGATGAQGSSVVKTFLTLPGWTVRSITRSPSSDKAKELASLGSEVVQADLSDPESLARAFEGAAAIFVNTDFWEEYHSLVAAGKDTETAGKIAYDTELQNAKNAAIAASNVSTLERYIYSALTPLKTYSKGKYSHAQHFESKAAAVNYIESDLTELAKKTSFIYVGIYNNNLFLFPQRDLKTGKFTLVLPGPKKTQLLIIDANNSVGLYVRALIEDEEPGLKLLAYDTDITAGDVVEAWSRVTGEDAEFIEMSVKDMHEILKIPLEYLDAAGFLAEFSYAAGLDVITPDQLKTKVNTESYQEFLEAKGKEALLKNEVVKV